MDSGDPPWRAALARAIRDPLTLLTRLGLTPADVALGDAAARQFSVRVPESYLIRMRPGDPADPLLRQVLPDAEEERTSPGFGPDPVGDLGAVQAEGVLRKYHGRALLMTTGACAIHCRYCFRRHFPYAEVNASVHAWRGALEVIAADASINEVILSGGDPLSLADRRLAALAEGLESIPHVHRLRLHSRLPVVLPERVDRAMLGWFTGGRLRPVMVLHANHAHELNDEVAEACARLRAAGAMLLNQSVLLRGVNDDASALAHLSERLFDMGVVPYYLHVLDPVAGAHHFDVDAARARALMRDLAARLPGYLVPRLVREIEGAPSKTWLDWSQPEARPSCP